MLVLRFCIAKAHIQGSHASPPLCGKRQKAHRKEEVSDEYIFPQPDESSSQRWAETRSDVRSMSTTITSAIATNTMGLMCVEKVAAPMAPKPHKRMAHRDKDRENNNRTNIATRNMVSAVVWWRLGAKVRRAGEGGSR